LLGRGHDLSFLADRLRQEPDRADWQREGRQLLAGIEASQSDLQRGVADLGERFYAERPRDFGARVGAWLDAWSVEGSTSVADAFVDPSLSVARQKTAHGARKAVV